MSNLQSDQGAIREISTKAERINEGLLELRRKLGQVREARRAYDNTMVLSMDQWVKAEQQRTGHMPDRNDPFVQKSFENYLQQAEKRKDEMKAQIEKGRDDMKSKVQLVGHDVAVAINDMERVGGHLKAIRKALDDVRRELDLSAQQLTMEHVSSMERGVRDLHWMQDQA